MERREDLMGGAGVLCKPQILLQSGCESFKLYPAAGSDDGKQGLQMSWMEAQDWGLPCDVDKGRTNAALCVRVSSARSRTSAGGKRSGVRFSR